MPTPFRVIALALALALASGCSKDNRDGEPRQPADEPEAAKAPTGVRASEGDQAQGAAVAPHDVADRPDPRAAKSFACDGGHAVAIADLVAVVTLADGRTVQIARDPDDAFAFHGEALSFRMKDGEGELAQEEVGVFHCKAG